MKRKEILSRGTLALVASNFWVEAGNKKRRVRSVCRILYKGKEGRRRTKAQA